MLKMQKHMIYACIYVILVAIIAKIFHMRQAWAHFFSPTDGELAKMPVLVKF